MVGPTASAVSAERDELRRLVDELAEDEVPGVVTDLRRRSAPASDRAWPPPWFGAASSTRSDTAARSEELLEDGFGRSA
jgi:hypothetical protein